MEKVVLKYITMISGVRYVTMTGTWSMPLWCAVSLAILVPLEPQQIHSFKAVTSYTRHSVVKTIFICILAGSNVPIAFDEVECTGAEGSLGECMFDTDHDCDHTEEAGVICIGKQ